MGKYSFSDRQDKRREERRPKPKPRQPIKRKLPTAEVTKVRSLAQTEVNIKLANDKKELDKWFAERRIEMSNCCIECGRSTNKFNEKYFRWSVAHIAPKGLIKSVATHPHNWIELCQLHHQEFDSTFERASKMMCFGEARQKFQLFKHLIPPEELRKVNPYLL